VTPALIESARERLRNKSGPPSPAQIAIVKQPQSAIIPSRRETALKRINDMQAELGRMNKLLDEMRADMLHLTIE